MKNHKIGLKKHARSPGSIANAEHADCVGAHKEISGSPGMIREIHVDDVEHAVDDFSIIRVTNDTGGTIFLWTGPAGENPTVTSANGIAIPDGAAENFYLGAFDDDGISVAFKLSAAAQVVVYEA